MPCLAITKRLPIPWLLPLAILLLTQGLLTAGEPLNLILPTPNQALYRGGGPHFYMYTDRSFGGKTTRPWQGGTYGFSRNPRNVAGKTLMTRFHEGIDIAPTRRDASGEPLDEILAISNGVVAHVNAVSNHSNYGKYLVLEHDWNGSRYYSFYAHIKNATVRKGQHVQRGQTIARMGYTGRGINKRRAHLHFEICLLLSPDFDTWHDTYYPRDTNRHHNMNGINLAGFDVAELYRRLAADPQMDLEEFLTSQEPAYTLRVPLNLKPHVIDFYPWMLRDKPAITDKSWEITLAAGGLPIRVEPSPKALATPGVASVNTRGGLPVHYLTKGHVTWNRDLGFTLTNSGLAFVDLLTTGRLIGAQNP
jgi:murein DD-endopeptidase MepM/ murein hydrolase activator NlpD